MSTALILQANELMRSKLLESVQERMPPGATRDFYCSVLSAESPVRARFEQVMGMPQFCQLTLGLLNGLVEDRDWDRALRISADYNVYLTSEVISDNLAIGLSAHAAGDPFSEARRRLLRRFNDAMVGRLSGVAPDAGAFLAPELGAAARASIFAQSLNPAGLRACAEAYAAERPEVDLAEVEYEILPSLVLNIEACADVAERMQEHLLGSTLREGLSRRYQAVSDLLDGHSMTLEALADSGAWAILVVPTLAYYMIALCEIMYPLSGLKDVVRSEALSELLYTAALLVRLQNDIGTRLLLMQEQERRVLRYRLIEQEQSMGDPPLRSVLLDACLRDVTFTRIHKDVEHGEWNLCLQGIAGSRPARDVIKEMFARIHYFASLYQQKSQRLSSLLAALEAELRDRRMSSLVWRFVKFHEALYSNDYRGASGEYAI